MIEKKLSAPMDRVYELLTEAKWLEQRCLDIGDPSAKAKVKKNTRGATTHIERRVKREVTGLVAKILPSEGDIVIDEQWTPDEDGYQGSLTLDLIGQPVKVSGDYSLRADGKGCVYRIQHQAKCSVPLVGGAVEKFVLGQVESGCNDELDYLARYLKKHK